MTDTQRALRMYELALSVVRLRGSQIAVGSSMITVYRQGLMTIRYWPKRGSLDVWYSRKVLRVERWVGTRQVIHYTPGTWEVVIERAAKVAA